MIFGRYNQAVNHHLSIVIIYIIIRGFLSLLGERREEEKNFRTSESKFLDAPYRILLRFYFPTDYSRGYSLENIYKLLLSTHFQRIVLDRTKIISLSLSLFLSLRREDPTLARSCFLDDPSSTAFQLSTVQHGRMNPNDDRRMLQAGFDYINPGCVHCGVAVFALVWSRVFLLATRKSSLRSPVRRSMTRASCRRSEDRSRSAWIRALDP